ncbi:MAG: hypothetical protein P1U65_17340 [Minwuia sp.]|nr:hypothetical protein [Minwuia sp.]
MDNIINLEIIKNQTDPESQRTESPMRFWKSGADTGTPPKQDSNGSQRYLPRDGGLDRYDDFASILKVALKSKPPERMKCLRFLARVFLYYPVRDSLLRKIGHMQVKRLVGLSLKLNRPDFRIDVVQSHDNRILVRLDSAEFTKGGAASIEILSGLLPGHDPYIALKPSDLRETNRRLIHLSELTDIGVLGPAD